MSFLNKLFKKNKEESFLGSIQQTTVEQDDEVTAVIAAAVASINEEEEVASVISAVIALTLGLNTRDFVVKNIKITHELDSVWAMAGRMKLMR